MLYYERWMCELEAESGQNPLFRFEGCLFSRLERIHKREPSRHLLAGLLFGGFRLKTTQRVEELVKNTVEALGFELCDVEFQKEYGNWVLTLYIDKPDGVTIDDCETVSKAVDPVLDETDPIEQAYYLSVSSLGLDRPLKKDGDYRRNIGKRIEIKLFAPTGGNKEFTGELLSFDDETVCIRTEKGEITLERKGIALAKPELKF